MRQLEEQSEIQSVTKQLISLPIVSQNNLERVTVEGTSVPASSIPLMEVVYRNGHIRMNNTI